MKNRRRRKKKGVPLGFYSRTSGGYRGGGGGVSDTEEKVSSWSRSGFATKAINSMNTICVINTIFSYAFRAKETHPFPRPLVCNRDRLYASPSFPPPNLAYPLIHHSGHEIFARTYLTSAPPPFNSWIRP